MSYLCHFLKGPETVTDDKIEHVRAGEWWEVVGATDQRHGMAAVLLKAVLGEQREQAGAVQKTNNHSNNHGRTGEEWPQEAPPLSRPG